MKFLFMECPGEYIPKHKRWIVPNPYNIPVHDQGIQNNCTSHAFALQMEYQLSDFFKERVIVDVDELWQKQKKYGTATEDGDSLVGPSLIAEQYGVRFATQSGRKGIYFLGGEIKFD
jgi:hypothetical protein